MNLWALVIGTCAGCYALKLAGYLVPSRVLDQPRVRRLVELLPVALLVALIVVQGFGDGRHIHVDGARLAGFGVGAFAVWRRAPFLLVVVAAALTAALIRLA